MRKRRIQISKIFVILIILVHGAKTLMISNGIGIEITELTLKYRIHRINIEKRNKFSKNELLFACKKNFRSFIGL